MQKIVKKKNQKKNIPFHTWSSRKVLEFFHSRPEGISSQEADVRLKRYGENILQQKKHLKPFFLFLKQFHNILIYILFLASGISFFVGHAMDGWIILVIIFFNACLGFILEYKAEKSIEALKNIMAPNAKILRDNTIKQIASQYLVPGDIVFLEEGFLVPADGRILFAKDVRVVESSLTGESSPQQKSSKILSENVSLADRENMLWTGTFIVSGEARMVVTATGSYTQLGQVAQKMESIEEVPTHFKERIRLLTWQMGIIAFFGTIATFLVALFLAKMDIFDVFLATVATLVSSIPEGLPVILTIVLAVSASRMAKRKAIVRSLPSIETLAVVDTILTDKTGTLTDNTMNIMKMYAIGEEEVTISGQGWDFNARFSQEGQAVAPLEKRSLRKLIHIAGQCNSAKVYPIEIKKEERIVEDFEVIGDPTEASLIVLARRAGLSQEILDASEVRVDDMPFRSQEQLRATLIYKKDEEAHQIYVVGAPEKIIAKCSFVLQDGQVRSFQDKHQEEILRQVYTWSGDTMRVLALAYREQLHSSKNIQTHNIEKLVFVGLVGMMDSPREGVSESISQAKRAGIRVIMATGDHKETAFAIAKKIGIASEQDKAYSQEELEKMTEKEFLLAVRNVNVFARLTPDMKYRITTTLQKEKRIVAVTGDGVNDALALRKADVGIAMGKNGSDVAKEAGSIILADDNFTTIVNAIEEGRIVFHNIQRASSFLVTTNFAEHATIISALSFGMPLPLLPTQILWLNLVTSGLPDAAIAVEPSHGRALHQPPMNARSQILSREIAPFLALMTVTMAILSLGTFAWFLDEGIDKARSAGFTVLCATQLFNAFTMRSLHQSIFSIGFFRNRFLVITVALSFILLCASLYFPPFQNVFKLTPLPFLEFFFLIILSSLVFFVGDIYKRIRYKQR